MKTYSGRLWLVPYRDTKLRVEIELDDEKIKVTSNENVIGDWALSEVVVRSSSRTEARLSAEGEELVIFTRDADFVPALASHKSQADEAKSGVEKDVGSIRTKGSLDANVVSFDRDRRYQPASASSSTNETETVFAEGDGAGADVSEPDRGAHRSEDRMLWKW